MNEDEFMKKYLIVNADDFGMCRSANDAVEELFFDGRLRSATVMLPCEASKEAVDFAVAHPEFAVGVHLTMTNEWETHNWKPLTDGKSLVDERGFMWRSTKQVEKNAKLKELKAEMCAQINRAHELGMKPSHLDNHMGSLYGNQTGRFTMLMMTMRVCGKYGYPFRLFKKTCKEMCPRGTPWAVYKIAPVFTSLMAKINRVVLPDYLLFPDWGLPGMKDSYEKYREKILYLWTHIPDGVTETFVHPTKESDEIKKITSNWRDRVWEYELMKDPETEKYLNAHGVELINYRDLVELSRQKKHQRKVF